MRKAFTLIEMLVALTILLILATITIVTVNVAANSDRVPGGTRQLQSFLEGAKDRAIYEKKAVGVRLIRDPNTPNVVTTLAYVEKPDNISEGTITIVEDVPFDRIETYPAVWETIERRKLLKDGCRIWIKDRMYTVLRDAGGWVLSRKFNEPYGQYAYSLELEPVLRANQEPRSLGNRVVIDLDSSRVPGLWVSGGGYVEQMDILFSPRGVVTDKAAVAGVIHLVVADLEDVDNGRSVGDPNKTGEERILTVRPATGDIDTFRVDLTDEDPADGTPDNPFNYANVGK